MGDIGTFFSSEFMTDLAHDMASFPYRFLSQMIAREIARYITWGVVDFPEESLSAILAPIDRSLFSCQ